MRPLLVVLLMMFALFANLPAQDKESDMTPWMDAAYETMEDTTETLATAYPEKALVIVNVASRCGFTRQYAGLEALNKRFADRGLVVLAFPSNDYGGQEPGTDEEVLEFCKSTFDVTFPVKSKMPTKGEGKSPLYGALTGPQSVEPGEVKWNFEKFVIGRDGRMIARFRSGVDPLSDEMVAAVEKALAEPAGESAGGSALVP